MTPCLASLATSCHFIDDALLTLLGLTTETIDVISAAPLLHTDSTQLSTVIDARTNVNLPLLSRN